jgi:Cu/Ag efflux protein CusF
MKRFALLFAAAVAVIVIALPATAGAATFRGVVISKDSARKALVTASSNGTVRTVRLHSGFKGVAVGRRVAVRAALLPDGTFSASMVKRLGKTRSAHVRGTVVKRLGARLVISAGGSVFALRVRGGKTGASDGAGLQPGDKVDCNAKLKNGGLEAGAEDIDEVGHEGRLVLEGIYLNTADDGTIELAVVHRGRVFVTVPADMEVPSFSPGDEVSLEVTIDDHGAFTLVKADNEDDADDDSGNGEGGISKDEFSVVGILASVTDASVAVKVEGHVEPVHCDVPDGFDLTGLAAGQRVYMSCKYSNGHFVLALLKQKDTPPAGDYIGVEGTLSTLDSSSVSVQVEGHELPVTCSVPAGTDLLGFAEGDNVKLYCWKKDGALVLKALISDHASIMPDGTSWFALEGEILDVNSAHVSIQVDGHPSPVTCAVAPSADLSGFHVGDQVTMKCNLVDHAFLLKLLKSDTTQYERV